MKKIFLLLAVMIFSSISFASVDTAIVATDLTNVDAMVASAAASSEGIPVFITENGMLNNDARNELASMGAKNVIIIGGPIVVKQEAEDELKLKYKVIRLWGIERTQTSIEVAKHFWPNVTCAVLVGDTKNDNNDAKIQLHASNLASRFGCILIPVPNGTMPAEVLKTLDELNVTHVKFVGKMNDEIRKSVKKFVLEELEDEDKVERIILNESVREGLKVVIIAAPDWRIANAIGSEMHHNSVVRMVSDASNETIQKLVVLIKENNVTDVRVVGVPALAQEIASALQNNGISVTKISGSKASEIAKEAWKENKEKWLEIREKAERRDAGMKLKIKMRLEGILNETETEFEEEEIGLEELRLGADISVLRQKLEEMKSKLVEIKQKIEAGDTEGAKLLLAEVRSEFRLKKWADRDRIKWEWRLEIENEEGNNNNIDNEYRKKLDNLEFSINDFRKACNSTAIENLIEKSKTLLAEAKNETATDNYIEASKLLREAKHVINEARSIGSVCLKEKKLMKRHMEIAEKRVEKAENAREKIRERIENSMNRIVKSEDKCSSDDDCACGKNINTGDCFYGNKNFVDTKQQCPDFCSGIAGNLVIKCVNNKCKQGITEEKEFNITSSSFTFSPNKISVKEGDKVKLRVTNTGGAHTFDIDELNIHKSTPAGRTTEIEFTASKSGNFRFYCSIDNHRVSGMEGNIVID